MSHTGVIFSEYHTPRRREGQVEALNSALVTFTSGDLAPRLRFLDTGDAAREPSAVVVWPDGAPLLAELVAVFANLGLRVAGHVQLPHPARQAPPAASAHRFDFCATDSAWAAQTPALVAEAFEAAAVGRMEVDGFTKLVATAGLPWQETVLVRAACRYVRQVGLEVSEVNVVAILLDQREFVRAFVALFHARFAPDLRDRGTAVASAETTLGRCVADTTTLDEDRVLRSLWSFVSAMLRTNWFQWDHRSDAAGRPAAFKIDPSRLSLSAAVIPYREIFVHAPIVEGSHVRGGEVARGGLRWSDRIDDFRTEVLGLMKTQNVKNSLIVPMGAKGAFVVRNSTDHSPEAVRRAYAAFIGGLLDVTDNIVDGRTVSPQQTVVYDGPDPYLVVAADKGTARFSDLANSIACERGFWLGDAFASGGSAGYDHKAMGITARGAWIAVSRHLTELGTDAGVDPVTVVGVGDMSGDVFGNGMLSSRSLQLVGAFDHRNIFLDPEPDPDASYRERLRLAGLPGGSWADYDRTVVSSGGGVWPRTAKSIALSPQVRARLGVTARELPPQELIKALLMAEVDLLWNGGIGTYVKASAEGHAAAADPTNDGVRIDARCLRCKVVGEGGNLGLTQRARIEYALAGGKINADFIDNAAGVATSDREVNLKIALDAATAAGVVDERERNALLMDVQDEVAASVLADSASQTLAISLAETHAPFLLDRHERLIDNLERDAGVNRVAEVLPSEADLVARQRGGRGLVRPEIAVLLAQSKNLVRSELLASPVIDDPVFADTLADYFPPLVRERIPTQIHQHRLGREIVAVLVANELIDRVGPGLIHRLEEQLGASTATITAAYAVVREVFQIDRFWHAALTVPGTALATRLQLLVGVQELIEQTTSWLLRHRAPAADPGAEIARFGGAVSGLVCAVPPFSGDLEEDQQTLRLLTQGFAFAEAARNLQLPMDLVAHTYRELGRTVGLAGLAARFAAEHHGDTHWETMAETVLANELQENWHALVGTVLRDAGESAHARDAVRDWFAAHPAGTSRLIELIGELRRSDRVDIAQLCVVNAELGLAVRSS